MKNANYRKHNDRTLSSSTYHKKDGTNTRAILKRETEKEIEEEMSLDLIKQLRAQTGLGLSACKKALEENDCDLGAAKRWLRENTKVKLVEEQESVEGLVWSYIHHNGKVGALVYLTAQTDFNTRSKPFVDLANDIAMHITAANPKYVSESEVLGSEWAYEAELARIAAEGKPDHIVEKIVEGKLRSFFKEKCLLQQPWVKDPKVTIGDKIKELSQRTGEAITVKKFTRFEVGMV